jgi:serine protease Do
MGFAIPTQIARPVVDTLLKDGKIEHARIGVGINDVTPENATFFHLDNASGALISQVEADSPAAKAGIKVDLTVMRDGKSLNLPVTLESINKKSDETASNSNGSHGKARWGVSLENLNADLRDQLQLPSDVKGVVVANVQPGSPADNAGISRGDVILEVNRKPVQNAEDVKRELSNVPAGKDAMVLLWSNGGSSFRVMHAAEPGADQNGD